MSQIGVRSVSRPRGAVALASAHAVPHAPLHHLTRWPLDPGSPLWGGRRATRLNTSSGQVIRLAAAAAPR